MNDPSHGVAQPLQNHVHLISSHRFPLQPAMNLEQAYRYLVDAPQIVKQIAPMAWQYVQAPSDGTVWLEWLPHNRGDRFPSDGYVWADVEQMYRQDYGGFTIEIMQHSCGYRLGQDGMTSHARTRYHFISKNPNHNAAQPDPLLWIVHYHQAEPGRIIPAQQAPPNPQMSQILNERRWLEGQGRLERKDFMLHDREHWPQLSVPGGGGQMRQPMQQPGMYGQSPMPGQPMRQPSFQQAPGGYPQPPPAKKMRQHTPSVSAGPNEAAMDSTIEDEENTTLGDYFDHLTPRDISIARYTQHHRWMEEVFSSPYASNQIVPADLGLGLMGELKGLTEGILEPPSQEALDRPQGRPAKPTEAQPFTNLTKDQIEEFNKRVEKHLTDGQAEIEKMKADHAAKMQEWKKTKILTQAEKRLRNATWAGHENAVPVHRLEVPVPNEQASKETVEDVVKDVEGLLGVKINSNKEANMTERGGLEEEQERPQPEPMDEAPEQSSDDAQQQDSNANQTPAYPQDMSSGMQGQQMQQTGMSQPSQPQAQNNMTDASANDMPSMDLGDDTMMGDIDLDVQFDDNALNGMNDADTPLPHPTQTGSQAPAEQNAAAPAASNPAPAAPAAPVAVSETTQQAAPQQAAAPPQQQQQPQSQSQTATPGNTSGDNGSGSANMFQDSAFDDLAGGDDGLIDFEGGMGMDDSAFGDALHGMENDTPGSGNAQ